MNIKEELNKLKALMSDGLTTECTTQIEQIKAIVTTPEDEAAIEDFISQQLGNIEEDVSEMEEMTYRLQTRETK